MMSDRIIMMSGGYVMAEGDIQGVRNEMDEHPIQIMIRCKQPALLASRVFALDSVVEARILEDGASVVIATRNADRFYSVLNRIVLDNDIDIETIAPADEDVHSVYQYLMGSNNTTT